MRIIAHPGRLRQTIAHYSLSYAISRGGRDGCRAPKDEAHAGCGRIRFNLYTLVLLLRRYISGRLPTWNRRRSIVIAEPADVDPKFLGYHGTISCIRNNLAGTPPSRR
jgi:hypothetical protein